MKIKNIKLARSIWIFDLQDLNPSGKDILEDVFEWIRTEYDFTVAPDLRALIAAAKNNPTGGDYQPLSGGLIFERGRFPAAADVSIEISKLTVYNDGIVIDTQSSTAEGDRFAQHLLQGAAREFSLSYDAETVRKRIYVSELIVRSEAALDLVNPRVAAFARRIGEAFPETPRPQFQIGGLQFWSEPNDVGKHKLFTLERQAGKTFAEGRYFSQAPFQTEEHFKLLQELEQIVIAS